MRHKQAPKLAQTPRAARTIVPADGCVAWRATLGCDPAGARDPANDLSCLQPVVAMRAGYCDCGPAPQGQGADLTGIMAVMEQFNPAEAEEPVLAGTLGAAAAGARTIPPGAKKLTECGEEFRKPFRCIDECNPVRNCIKWRQTSRCLASGFSDRRNDKDCREVIHSGDSGYCECDRAAGARVAESNCSHAPFTCEDECRKHEAAQERGRRRRERERVKPAATKRARL